MDFEQRQMLAIFCGGLVDIVVAISSNNPLFGVMGVSLIATASAHYIIRKWNNKKR